MCIADPIVEAVVWGLVAGNVLVLVGVGFAAAVAIYWDKLGVVRVPSR